MHLPHARVANIARAIERLQDRGFWVVGLDERAEVTIYDDACPPGRIAVVVGSEGEGMARLTRERCDRAGLAADARARRVIERGRLPRRRAVRVRAARADLRARLTSRRLRADTRTMDQGMPPPPSGSYEAWERVIEEPIASPPRRPVAVTVAGVLLIVAGGFAALAAG